MSERKSLSKKVRFEVFKRDHFTCQYCGAMAPDVILEIDHIKPVAEGGSDDLLNLITSCRDCNRGKGKVRLSDNTELKKQQEQLKELAERREQSEMMIRWRTELLETINKQVDYIDKYIGGITGWSLTDAGTAKIRKLIRSFSFNEVATAVEIAFDSYWDGSEDSWHRAYNKIGGICYNRRMQKDGYL